MIRISTLFLLLPLLSSAQTFYISEIDKPIYNTLKNRISTLGYRVTDDKKEADYITELVYEKKKGYMSFKSGYHKVGFVRFLDSKGVEIAQTKEQGGRAYGYNTYSALSTLFKKIMKEDFDSTLKKAVASYTPAKKEQPQGFKSKADELAKLKKLFDEGVLTKEEFEAAKRKILE